MHLNILSHTKDVFGFLFFLALFSVPAHLKICMWYACIMPKYVWCVKKKHTCKKNSKLIKDSLKCSQFSPFPTLWPSFLLLWIIDLHWYLLLWDQRQKNRLQLQRCWLFLLPFCYGWLNWLLLLTRLLIVMNTVLNWN